MFTLSFWYVLWVAFHKRRQLGGSRVKNWSKLLTDRTEKLPIWGRGVSKIQKNCRRILWMVPIQELKLNSQWPHCFYGVVFDFLKRVYDFKRYVFTRITLLITEHNLWRKWKLKCDFIKTWSWLCDVKWNLFNGHSIL